jgi:hypothetical protein
MNSNVSNENLWKKFHASLVNGIASKYKADIQHVLNISQSAFYRKLNNPSALSIAENVPFAKFTM